MWYILRLLGTFDIKSLYCFHKKTLEEDIAFMRLHSIIHDCSPAYFFDLVLLLCSIVLGSTFVLLTTQPHIPCNPGCVFYRLPLMS